MFEEDLTPKVKEQIIKKLGEVAFAFDQTLNPDERNTIVSNMFSQGLLTVTSIQVKNGKYSK